MWLEKQLCHPLPLSVPLQICAVQGIREGHLEFFPDGHNMSPEGKAGWVVVVLLAV